MSEMPAKTYTEIMNSADRGHWHDELIALGFLAPEISFTGDILLPVDTALRELDALYSDEEIDGALAYRGIGRVVYNCAIKYGHFYTGLHHPKFSFCTKELFERLDGKG